MRVLTCWSMDETAAAMSWRYPALAEEPFPSGAINEVLAAIYNDDREALNHPYLFIVRDAKHQIIGLVVTDPEGVALDQPDINALYWSILDERSRRWAGNIEGDTYAIPWRYPSGQVFPADPLNAILAALYNMDLRPFIYPAYDHSHPVAREAVLQQVGLIISPLRDLPGDASENWRTLRDTYRTITSDDDTYPHDVPWGQKEWNLE